MQALGKLGNVSVNTDEEETFKAPQSLEEALEQQRAAEAAYAAEEEALKQSYKDHINEKEHEVGQKVRQLLNGNISNLAGLMERAAVAGSYDGEFITEEKKKGKEFRDLIKLIDRINADQQRLAELNKEIGELEGKIEAVKERFQEEYGDDWAETVGEKYSVDRRPGETQADYERRVLQAADRAGDERASGVSQDYADLDEKYKEKKEIVARLDNNYDALETRAGELNNQIILLNEANKAWKQIKENPDLSEQDWASARKAWHQEYSELNIDENASPEEVKASLSNAIDRNNEEAAVITLKVSEIDKGLALDVSKNPTNNDSSLLAEMGLESKGSTSQMSAAKDVEGLGTDAFASASLKLEFNDMSQQTHFNNVNTAPIPTLPNPSA